LYSFIRQQLKDRECTAGNKKLKIVESSFLPGVETAVDYSDVAIGQQGIVGRGATAERAEDGRIAFDFVPEAKILRKIKIK